MVATMSKTSAIPLGVQNGESFGQRLRRLRKAQGFSQTELGEIISTSKRAVSSYECDQREPPAHIIPKLATLLDVSSDYLLGLEGEATSPKSTPLRRRWMRRVAELEKLPERKQQALMQVMDMALRD